jgi:hypothetical protein
MSWQQWFSVLKLSLMWEMSEIQQVAMGKVLSLPVSKKEWVDVLKLSTLSHVLEIRTKAIERLSSGLQPVERVLLARECLVSQWLTQGYREIVTELETISEADADKLGCKTTVKLFLLRENLRLRRYGYDIEKKIKSVFKFELEKLKY